MLAIVGIVWILVGSVKNLKRKRIDVGGQPLS
jgi:hypothetical protein